jgi:hypothetical protein
MASNQLTVCELWDVTLPDCPSRSRLYHLAPIRVGAPDVESLTSYIARLAAAHNVYTGTLVEHELLPLLQKHPMSEPGSTSASYAWPKFTQPLNGFGTLARKWTQALETLTLRSDLRFLTLLTWSQVLTFMGLLRRERAWCPVCYEEWRETGQVVYEPLLWALRMVTVCPRHGCRLSSRCPHQDCQQSQQPLAPRSRPGYCTRCERWLGIPSGTGPLGNEVPTEDELQWQTWVTNSIGELVATAPSLSEPPRKESIAHAVSVYVEQMMGGKHRTLSRELGLHMERVGCWLQGENVPQLEWLLRMCHRFGTSPLYFLTEESIVVDPTKMNAPMRQDPSLTRKRAPRLCYVESAQAALEAVLASEEYPPPSLRQVTIRLGYCDSNLKQQFPELCRSISARYLAYRTAHAKEYRQQIRDEVRQAVLKVHAQGMYPNGNRVASLLRTPGTIRHPEALATYHQTLRELGWES